MTQAELLRYVVEIFEALGIDYMISGSQASIYYGESRFTQDIDIVAHLDVAHVAGLLAHFPLPEFYVAEDAIRSAVAEHGQFNIIHPGSGLMVDVIARKDTPGSPRRARGTHDQAASKAAETHVHRQQAGC